MRTTHGTCGRSFSWRDRWRLGVWCHPCSRSVWSQVCVWRMYPLGCGRGTWSQVEVGRRQQVRMPMVAGCGDTVARSGGAGRLTWRSVSQLGDSTMHDGARHGLRCVAYVGALCTGPRARAQLSSVSPDTAQICSVRYPFSSVQSGSAGPDAAQFCFARLRSLLRSCSAPARGSARASRWLPGGCCRARAAHR